jgi:hypothetical protein
MSGAVDSSTVIVSGAVPVELVLDLAAARALLLIGDPDEPHLMKPWSRSSSQVGDAYSIEQPAVWPVANGFAVDPDLRRGDVAVVLVRPPHLVGVVSS